MSHASLFRTHNLIKLDTNTYYPKCSHNTSVLQPSLTRSQRGNKKYQIHHHTGVVYYIEMSEMPETANSIKTSSKEMIIVHLNCRSIMNKVEELEMIVQQCNPDIIVLDG